MSTSTRHPATAEIIAPPSHQRFSLFWKDHNGRSHAGPHGVLEDHIDDAFQHYLTTLLDAAPDAAAINDIFSGHGMSASCPSFPGQGLVGAKTVIRILSRESRPLLVCNVRRGTVTGGLAGLAVAFDVSRTGTDWTTCAELLTDDDQIIVAEESLSMALTAAAGEVCFSGDEQAEVFTSVQAWLRHDRRYNGDQPCIPSYWRFAGNDGETLYGFGNAIDKDDFDWLTNRERTLSDCCWGERLTSDEVLRLRLHDRADLLDLASIAEAERAKWSAWMLEQGETADGEMSAPANEEFNPFKRLVARKNGEIICLSV